MRVDRSRSRKGRRRSRAELCRVLAKHRQNHSQPLPGKCLWCGTFVKNNAGGRWWDGVKDWTCPGDCSETVEHLFHWAVRHHPWPARAAVLDQCREHREWLSKYDPRKASFIGGPRDGDLWHFFDSEFPPFKTDQGLESNDWPPTGGYIHENLGNRHIFVHRHAFAAWSAKQTNSCIN